MGVTVFNILLTIHVS